MGKMYSKNDLKTIKGMFQSPLIPKNYFVTGGKAVSSVSSLNAFDAALSSAGIAQCNLVSVSSILPMGAKEVEKCSIPPGTITFAVLSRMDGLPGETICAGIAWGWTLKGERLSYGLVAEGHGSKSEEEIREELRLKLAEMAEARGVKLSDVKFRIEYMKVPEEKYGCVIAALIYDNGQTRFRE
ncbi:MAG: pyruvoyl-dependent arginine decarboxylase [Candidatus Bathyarchaeia archaeon]